MYDLEGIMLSKINQTKTNIDTVLFHLYVESKKQNKQAKQNINKLIGTENKLVVAREEGGGGMEIGEVD